MKAILKIIRIMIIIVSIFLLTLFGKAYYEYKNLTRDMSIESRVDEKRRDEDFVKLENINSVFLESIVATEDRRFYKHGAIEIRSIVRAALNNLITGNALQGGSTITQQLAKNLMLSNDRTYMRKLKEVFISNELERMYTKNEILELYVNIIYYGDGYEGIGEASYGYFNKSPRDLSYEEGTLLAGIPQSPNYYSLSKNFGRAKKRQAHVIEALKEFDREESLFNYNNKQLIYSVE